LSDIRAVDSREAKETPLLQTLRGLAAVQGPPGREAAVAREVAALIEPHVDCVQTDALGNVIATLGRAGGGETVMVAAHLDQPAFIVTEVDKLGRLRVSPAGRMDPLSYIGCRVTSDRGTTGVVAADDGASWKELTPGKMHVDVGAAGREEALALAAVGDMFCPQGSLVEMGPAGTFLVSPALDDRAGCAVLVEAARRLEHPAGTVHFVFTVQGAVAPRGARPAAHVLEPDFGLSVDITPAGEAKGRSEVVLGKGPALRVKDAGYVAPAAARERLARAAQAAGVALQLEVLPSDGSAGDQAADAAAVQRTRTGVPAAAIGLPARHAGTPAAAVNLDDLEGTVRLLVSLLT